MLDIEWAQMLCPGHGLARAALALLVVAGRHGPLRLRFRGEVGISPNRGAAIALWPDVAAMWLPLRSLLAVLTGYASATALILACSAPELFALRAVAFGNYGRKFFVAAVPLNILSAATVR